MVDIIRGLVRPAVTILAVIGLLVLVIILVIKHADLEMAKTILQAFLIMTATITSYWFATRKTQ